MGFQVKTAQAVQYAGNTSVERCTVNAEYVLLSLCELVSFF